MKINSKMLGHTAIMTAVNLIMKSVAVSFNAYLTNKIGTDGIGLFQLYISVYSLAVTAACAGVKLSAMRLTVETAASGRYDVSKTIRKIIGYGLFCALASAVILYGFSDFIALKCISGAQSGRPLQILALSLPFVSVSAALGGYFTAVEKIPQYSAVQLIEQIFRIGVTVFLLNNININSVLNSVCAITAGMTAAEIFSATLSLILKKYYKSEITDKKSTPSRLVLRIALPDGAGTFLRSLLLTFEHLLIPKGFRKSGADPSAALSAYGAIHGMALPVLLYPNAILVSFSTLLISDLARKRERKQTSAVNETVKKNLKISGLYSLACAAFFVFFADTISQIVYKSNEAAQYIKILAPLVPVMYLDTVTDGMLKGLDQQLQSMRYNIFDSALCIALVVILLPKYSVKGYIFILYLSELINFYLSFSRLIQICEIRIFTKIKAFLKLEADSSTLFPLTRCSDARTENGYRTYQGREKHSQALRFYRRKGRIQDLREWQ